MQFTAVAITLCLSLASAVPTSSSWQGQPINGNGNGQLCSNSQQAACCDPVGESTVGAGGLLGLGGILSGDCTLTVVGGQCTQGSIACCPTDGQTGLINVGSICAPISL